MQKITPFLWFDANIDEVVSYYTSIFIDAEVITKTPGPGGMFMSATMKLNGQELIAFGGGPMFKFNESISLFIHCETQEEVDYYWSKLTADGGQESRCGWLIDKYGLSWQVIPSALRRLMQDKDAQKATRVVQAMMKMSKIIVADLEAAYNG